MRERYLRFVGKSSGELRKIAQKEADIQNFHKIDKMFVVSPAVASFDTVRWKRCININTNTNIRNPICKRCKKFVEV